jgi:hypothetical protein
MDIVGIESAYEAAKECGVGNIKISAGLVIDLIDRLRAAEAERDAIAEQFKAYKEAAEGQEPIGYGFPTSHIDNSYPHLTGKHWLIYSLLELEYMGEKGNDELRPVYAKPAPTETEATDVWEASLIEAANAVVRANQANTGSEPSVSLLACRIDELREILDDADLPKPTPMTLDERMEQAGMLSVAEILKGAPMDGLMRHAGVKDLETLLQWAEMRRGECLRSQAEYDLGKEHDDMYEWTVAHAAVFTELHVNLRAAIEGQQAVPDDHAGKYEELRLAAFDVLSWIEAKHRPPVDDMCGGMGLVRLHALERLHKAFILLGGSQKVPPNPDRCPSHESEHPLPDEELPGMWSNSDLCGGYADSFNDSEQEYNADRLKSLAKKLID